MCVCVYIILYVYIIMYAEREREVFVDLSISLYPLFKKIRKKMIPLNIVITNYLEGEIMTAAK